VAGFLSLAPDASVVAAKGWFARDGYHAAKEVLKNEPTGVFGCNDRLVEGIVRRYRERNVAIPPIVGFDDAPIAATLGLTTIAIPWTEIGRAVARLSQARLAGDTAGSQHLLLHPVPVFRDLGFASTMRPKISVQ